MLPVLWSRPFPDSLISAARYGWTFVWGVQEGNGLMPTTIPCTIDPWPDRGGPCWSWTLPGPVQGHFWGGSTNIKAAYRPGVGAHELVRRDHVGVVMCWTRSTVYHPSQTRRHVHMVRAQLSKSHALSFRVLIRLVPSMITAKLWSICNRRHLHTKLGQDGGVTWSATTHLALRLI